MTSLNRMVSKMGHVHSKVQRVEGAPLSAASGTQQI